MDTPKQARARAGGEHGNKGRDAMAAVLDTIGAADAIRDGVRRLAVLQAGPDKTRARPKKGRPGAAAGAGKGR